MLLWVVGPVFTFWYPEWLLFYTMMLNYALILDLSGVHGSR